MEVLISCHRDKETINAVLEVVKECMINRLNMSEYCIPNHPCKWTWPKHLAMGVDISMGDSYGDIMPPGKYMERFTEDSPVVKEKESEDFDLVDVNEDEIM